MEGITTSTYATTESAIDTMFYNFTNSSIYSEVNLLMSLYIEDMNYVSDDDNWFLSEVELYEWVSVNLSQTNFNSLEEAQNKWSFIVNQHSVMVEQFPEIYDFLGNESEEIVLPLIKKWLLTVNTNGEGEQNCDKNFEYCTSKVAEDYSNAEKSIHNGVNSADIRPYNDMKYKNGMDKCRRDYKACIT